MTDSALEGMRHYWDRGFNGQDAEVLAANIADDYVNHAALPGTPPGPAGQTLVLRRLWAAVPDAHFDIEHLVRDGQCVICVGTMTGTHAGEIMGAPASGAPVTWRQCHLITLNDEGKASTHRAIRDDLGLLRQIGAWPRLEALT